MEFCGGHTHAISRYGLEDLLPDNVRMIHGPGCPVCVLPMARIDMAIRCARLANVTLCAYGDLMRVPGSNGASLIKAKAEGADIRMVYSTLDAIRIAEKAPDREVVFFAIGFETTTPPTALAIRAAREEAADEFLGPLQSRDDPAGDARDPRQRRRQRSGRGAGGRLRRPGACQHGHRHRALSGVRRAITASRSSSPASSRSTSRRRS